MNMAESFVAITKNGMCSNDEYKFQNMLFNLCESNERKGRFMFWTFEDGSTIRAYGYGLRMTYKVYTK